MTRRVAGSLPWLLGAGLVLGLALPAGGGNFGVLCEDETVVVGRRSVFTWGVGTPGPKRVDFLGLEGADRVELDDTTFTGVEGNFTFGVRGQSPGPAAFLVQTQEEIGQGSDTCFTTFDVVEEPVDPVAMSTFYSLPHPTPLGDPLSMATGELVEPESPDLHLGGPLPLYFVRLYASLLERDGNVTSSLGRNWTHNFDWKLTVQGSAVRIATPLGRVLEFSAAGGSFTQTGRLDLPFQLRVEGGGFALGDPRSGWVRTFDGRGLLIRVEDGRGNVHNLRYAGGRLDFVNDGLGRRLDFTYAGNGELREVTDGTRTVRYAHSGGNLTAFTDAEGGTTRYTYAKVGNVSGLLVSRTFPEGNTPLEQDWDAAARVREQENAFAQRDRYAYADGRTTATDPAGKTQVYSFDETTLSPTQRQDEAGKNVVLTHDAAGRLTSVKDRLGRTTTYAYHAPTGLISLIVHADGTRTELGYTPRAALGFTVHDLSIARFRDGSVEQYAHDARGNLTAWADRGGNVWGAAYNDHGQVTKLSDPSGAAVAFEYDGHQNLIARHDAVGGVTRFEHDELDRLERVIWPDGERRSFAWNDNGRLGKVTDEAGKVTTFGYDDNGNLVRTTDPLGRVTTLAYDAMDRASQLTDAAGGVRRVTYDSLGRVATVRDGNGNARTLGYDTVGHLARLTDAAGKAWTLKSNAEGAPASAADPLSRTWAFTTDAMGRVTRVRSPLRNRVDYTYDAAGRVTQAVGPDGHTVAIVRDARGLVTGVAAGGVGNVVVRDGRGKVVNVVDPRGALWGWAYDAAGRPTLKVDPLGNATAYEYDARGRMAKITLPGGLGTTTFGYDARGLLTRRRFSDRTTISYAYDAVGRLVSATGLTLAYDAANRVTSSNGLGAQYDAGGRLTRVTLAAGKTVRYEYDSRDRLGAVVDWLGGRTELRYDDVGRLLRVDRINNVDSSWRYDADGRLIGLQHGGVAAIDYELDDRGKVVSEERDLPFDPPPAAGVQDYAYDAGSRVVKPGFVYDALGRMTSDGVRTLTWDLASRLRRVKVGGATTSFTYDAFDRPLTRTRGGTTRSFVWHYAYASPRIAVERQGGKDLRHYVHTPWGELLYSVEADGKRRHFHFDAAGNTLFVSGQTGQVEASFAYDPLGAEIAAGKGGAQAEAPLVEVRTAGVHGALTHDDLTTLPGGRTLDSLRLATLQPAVVSGAPQTGGDSVDGVGVPGGLSDNFCLHGLYAAVEGGFELVRDGPTGDGAFADRYRHGGVDTGGLLNIVSRSHELRFGAGYREAEVTSLSRWPGANRFHDVRPAAEYTSAYVQDTLTLGSLTANLGLRYDLQASGLGAVCEKSAPLFALPHASTADPGLQWESLAPRLGLTYALGAERKTILRAAYNRYLEQLGSASVTGSLPGASAAYSYSYLAPSARSYEIGAEGGTPSTTEELLFAAEHALRPEFVVGLHATYRQFSEILGPSLPLVSGGEGAATESHRREVCDRTRPWPFLAAPRSFGSTGRFRF